MFERAPSQATLIAGHTLLALSLLVGGCVKGATEATVTVKTKAPAGTALKTMQRSFKINYTDASGAEKTADPASLVQIKINGKAVTTHVTDSRTVLDVDDAPDTAVVEADMKTGGSVSFKASDIAANDATTDTGSTVWMMPWKAGAFLGQVGPDTHPMSVLGARATTLPMGTTVTAAQLQSAYIGNFRLPRHLVDVQGATVMLDISYVFCLQAAEADGDVTPALNLLVNQDGFKVITITPKAWPDTAPTGDTPPTLRTTSVAITADQLSGDPVTTSVDSQAAYEATLKVQSTYFPAPVVAGS